LACSIIGFVFGLAAVAGIVLGFRARRNIIRAGAVKGAQVALAGIIAGFGAIAFLTTLALVGAFGGHPTSDAALAQSELILPSQYPHGFVGRGPGTNVTQASYFSSWGPHIVRCLYMSTADVDPHPVETGSQEWDRGTAWVNDTIDVFPTAATAHTDETAAVNPNALSCAFRSWGPTLDQEIGPGLGAGEHDNPPIAFGVTALGHDISDEAWSMGYTYKEKPGISYNNWIIVQAGRSEPNIWLSNRGSPVPTELVDQLVKAAELRIGGS
jgi:hypothetical protein